MRFPNKQLYSYNISNGDEIIVDSKQLKWTYAVRLYGTYSQICSFLFKLLEIDVSTMVIFWNIKL
jgi:hypothetical protein